MSMPDHTAATEPSEFGPWNPGIKSSLPRAILSLATVFRPENVETRLEDALELNDVCGLPLTAMVRFRAERLVIHEVLIRVMADLSVPMGQTYGDLGVNFRAMVTTILNEVTASRREEVARLLTEIRTDAAAILDREVSAMLKEGPGGAASPPHGSRSWRTLFGTPERPAEPDKAPSPEMRAIRYLDAWRLKAAESGDPLAIVTCTALQSVVSAILRRRGFLIKDKALLVMLAGTLVSNQYGSVRIGELIDPWFREAGERNGHRRLPAQTCPVIMNVKGSSASGKSTIRPYQRALVGELGLDWSDFALITPDVWRKYLLDYDGLGSERRYAGPLTGHEVEIIDGKLDQYMASKAAAGRISHLLIDRFRFDSFVVDQGTETGGQLLTRFGRQVYMQFMITPPEATVERAWKRGEQFGRYKAVEDLLAHNVEAYTGMPRLFFTWALRADKEVHFEFLDNSVSEGERPRTIAFGTNGVMTILDLKVVFDIDRFRKIDINARSPQEVYAGAGSMEPDHNASFLRDCVRRMTTVRFADHATGRVYARCDGGRLTRLDRAAARRAEHDPDLRAALAAMGAADGAVDLTDGAEVLCHDDGRTLGSWGADPAPSA